MDMECDDGIPFEVELGDLQVVRLVSSSTLQLAPFVFRAHRVSAQHLTKLEVEAALEAYHFEIVDDGTSEVTLSLQPQKCLRILPNRSVDGSGGRGPWATFVVAARDAAGVALRTVGHGIEKPAYLAANSNSSTSSSSVGFAAASSPQDPASRWFFEPVQVSSPFDSFDLSAHQYDDFARDGFAIVKDAVPTKLLEDALRFINNFIGKGPSAWVVDPEAPVEPGEGPKMKLPSSSHPSLMQLMSHTCLGVAAQRLLGAGKVRMPGSAQLAVRFPVTDRLESFGGELTEAASRVVHRDNSTNQFHIDGTGKESALPFSLLCKVALSDQTAPHCGNFTVFPGSHRNPEVIRWYFAQLSGGRAAAVAAAPPRPEVGAPCQVRLAPGDAALVHPYLCHRIGTNTSPNVRYSVIFRMRSNDFAAHVADPDALARNPMLEFPWFPDSRRGYPGADLSKECAEKVKQQKTFA